MADAAPFLEARGYSFAPDDAGIGAALRYQPVSYTHLDVYKRQPLDDTMAIMVGSLILGALQVFTGMTVSVV